MPISRRDSDRQSRHLYASGWLSEPSAGPALVSVTDENEHWDRRHSDARNDYPYVVEFIRLPSTRTLARSRIAASAS